MPKYSAFGGNLESFLSFPELRPGTGEVCLWTVEEGVAPALAGQMETMGWDAVHETCKVRAYRRSTGYSLIFDDTGRFDVSADGKRISWYRPEANPEPAARADILGRVLPLALHANGVFSLHASAVSIAGKGIAFVAPKYHGKSTMATALLLQGAKLISDDVLPIRISEPPVCLPGLPHLRLWRDAARATFRTPSAGVPEFDSKVRIDSLTDDMLEHGNVPMDAAYLLTPVSELPGGLMVRRDPTDGLVAALALVQQAKLGPLLTGDDAGLMFSQAASVAASVPIFDLYVVRNLARLDQVAAAVAGWHREGHQGAAEA